MRKVYSTTVIGQAEMLQVVLRGHGIESRLENEGAAHYAVGLPSAAAPIVIVVDDDRAEEAARIISEEFTKPRTPDPTQAMVQMPCPCGKTLEFPKGEEPPAECPWCDRPTQAAPAPDDGAARSRPIPRGVWAGLAIAATLVLGSSLFGGYHGIRKAIRDAEEAIDPHPALARRLKERIEAIPSPTLPAIDPDAIAASLTPELPEEAARFAAAFAPATTAGELAGRWLLHAAELSPDWALNRGVSESPKLGRYTARLQKACVLLDAQALRKLRSLQSEAGTLDGRLMERFLERDLLEYLLFGPELRDPRAALWGVQASAYVKDRPALLAERLEQVPDVVAEVTRELREINGPMIELALRDLNEGLETLRDFERTVPDPRSAAAVAKAREALVKFRTHLRAMTAAPMRAPDPRWILFLVREGEFSTRSPRDAARFLFSEGERALVRWNAQGAAVAPVTASYTKEQWRSEMQQFVAKARDLTIERGFAEVPGGDLPVLIDSPLLTRGAPDAPTYGSRPLAATVQGMLWVTSWDTSASPLGECSATSAQISTLAETYPGRHLHEMLSRREGTVARRLYMSHMLSEGWRSYCQKWAIETIPNSLYNDVHAQGTRFSQAWSAAVEICFLAGTLAEAQAVEFLQGGTGESKEDARARLAWSLVEPLWAAGSVLGERDLLELRNELQAKLGAQFDLKRFHTRVLTFGRAPLALIREEMLRDGK